MSTIENLRMTVELVYAASRRYLNGNPAPFLACWSHAEDVTIFGAWGAYERGWEQVRPRLEWGAKRYRGGTPSFELLSLAVSGNLGYSVWVERGDVLVEGQKKRRPQALRVTQLYRWEENAWKIIHRHGDAIITKTEAPAVLQP